MNLFTFSKHFKHVDVYANNGTGWVGFRLSSSGLTYAMTGQISGDDLTRLACEAHTAEAVIVADVGEPAKFKWCPLTIPMCNEFARLISGVNIGFSWSPRHLYNKLLRYDQTRNYEIIYKWRRSNGARQ